jgi:Ca2+-binding RTX toxin-like protein
VFEGTEGDDEIVGTPGADQIDSKGGNDQNFGDTLEGDGSGDDVIVEKEISMKILEIPSLVMVLEMT